MEPAIASLSSLDPDGGIETPPLPPPGAHAATHLPLGGDAIATDAPVSLTPSTNNEEGTANAFSNAAHAHKIAGAAHSGSYGLNPTEGILPTGFLKNTGILRFPSGLAPVSPSAMIISAAESGGNINLISNVDGKIIEQSGLTADVSGNIAYETFWPRGVDVGEGSLAAGSPWRQSVQEWVVTDNLSARQVVCSMAADFSPDYTSREGSALIFIEPTIAAGRSANRSVFLGFVREDALRAFTGMELEKSSSSFYQNSSKSFSTIANGLQFGNANVASVLENAQNTPFVLRGNYGSSSGSMFLMAPRNTAADPVGEALLEIASSITGFANEPRFYLWGEGRGAQLVEGDLTYKETGKGPVHQDTQGTPRYWRRKLDATGTGDRVVTLYPGGWMKVEEGTTGNLTLTYEDAGTIQP